MKRALVNVRIKVVHVEAGGHFFEGEIEPLGEPIQGRIASPYPGFYFPVVPGVDGVEWLVAIPQGEGASEPVALAPLWSTPAPPPAEAVADPANVWLVTSATVHVKAGVKAIVEAPIVEQGATPLSPTTGVVQGEAVDTFTGATFFVLGSASAVVRAKK